MQADLPATLLLALLLSGCIDHLLEAPYVLASGVGPGAGSLSPTADQTFLVAGQAGVFEVDGSGKVHQVRPAQARAAVGHGDWVALVDDQGVAFGRLAGGRWTETSRTALPGIQAAQAWCDEQVLLLTGTTLQLLGPGQASARPWAAAPTGALDLGLGPGDSCAAALVLTPTTLVLASPTGQRDLVTGLSGARTVALDRRQQAWVVHGDPLVVARVEDGQAVTVARHLGDVVDMHFGTGDLLHPDNAYLLTREGTLDYVRVPSPAAAPAP